MTVSQTQTFDPKNIYNNIYSTLSILCTLIIPFNTK